MLKVKNIGMMNEKQKKAHLRVPCPVCGKINTPYAEEPSLISWGKTIYHFNCRDSSVMLEFTPKTCNRKFISGCSCEYSIKINAKKELQVNNLQLSEELINNYEGRLTQDIKLIYEADEIQRKYWTNKFNNDKVGIKKKIEKLYVKILKFIVKLCK